MYRITLFGGFRVEYNGQEVQGFRSRKGKLLLAYLATFRGNHSRAQLARLFYAGRSRTHAMLSLRVEIAALRRMLEPFPNQLPPLLTVTRETLSLNEAVAFVDVHQFEWLLEQATQLEGASQASLLEQACELYQGDYLEGFDALWISPKREVYRQQFADALRDLCKIYINQSEYMRASQILKCGIEKLPKKISNQFQEIIDYLKKKMSMGELADEGGVRYTSRRSLQGLFTFAALYWPHPRGMSQLVARCSTAGGILVHRGDRLVVAAFDNPLTAAQWVSDEVAANSELSAAITMDIWSHGSSVQILATIQQLVLSLHSGWIVCTEPVAHWLRRESKWCLHETHLYLYTNSPERLFVLNAKLGETLSPFRKGSSPLLRERSLPLPAGPLWGRDLELQALHRWYQAARHTQGERLLTLVGIGGIGKTRLALEFAHQISAHPPEEVVFVSLENISNPSEIERSVLSAMSEDLPQLRVRLSHALRSRPVLLILDRVEHLKVALSDLLQEWFANAPQLKVLTTSRIALDIPGEQVLSLAPLPLPPENLAEPMELQRYASVQLFLAEARHARPDFRLTSHNAPIVAALCRYAGGVPLALKLLAKRLSVYTPSQLLAALHTDSLGEDPVRRSIGWSFYQLPADQRRVLCILSLFRDKWTLESAREILQEPLIHDYIDRLLTAGLVVAHYEQNCSWFSVPAPVREFASALLDASTRATIERRYVFYYLQLARQILSDCPPLTEGHIDQLRPYQEHLLTSIEWAACLNEVELLAEMLILLAPFFEAVGIFETPLRWGEQLLGGALPAEKQVRLLNALARLHHRMGNSQKAEHLYRSAADQASSTDQRAGLAEALIGLAGIHLDMLNIRDAEQILTTVLSDYKEWLSPLVLADALLRLGYALAAQMRVDEAQQHMEQAIALYRQVGEQRYLALALNALGFLMLRHGNLTLAESLLSESLTLLQAIQDRGLLPFALLRWGDLHKEKGFSKEAIKFYHEALELSRSVHMTGAQRAALARIGEMCYFQHRYRQAKLAFQEAHALATSSEMNQEHPLLETVWIALLNNNFDDAKILLINLLKLVKEKKFLYNINIILEMFGLLFAKKQKFDIALYFFEISNQIRKLWNVHINSKYLKNKINRIKKKFNWSPRLRSHVQQTSFEEIPSLIDTCIQVAISESLPGEDFKKPVCL